MSGKVAINTKANESKKVMVRKRKVKVIKILKINKVIMNVAKIKVWWMDGLIVGWVG